MRAKLINQTFRFAIYGGSIALLIILSAVAANGQDPEAIDFSRDIQPILSENCYFCHGQDANQREADLRLDVE